MTAEQTTIIADILGQPADIIAALPEEIKSEMDFIAENSAPETQEERLEVYLALEELWQKAITAQVIDDISDKFNVGREVLDAFDNYEKKNIVDMYLLGADDAELIEMILSADKEQSEKEFQRIMNDG